ncbi:MAG: radical SAM protein [Paludibacteraceae bacterium]
MLINQIVLKITNRCNLNCSYCYVFNKGNYAFLVEPSFISDSIIIELFNKIEVYCKRNKIKRFYVVFHGGEPLLLGRDFFSRAVSYANTIVKSTDLIFSLQTNGTLINNEWCDLFSKFKIHVGISFDGTELANKDRVFRKDSTPAFQSILSGIKIYSNRFVDTSILSVINTTENPIKLYSNLKELNITSADFLFPDINYDTNIMVNDDISFWLIDLFNVWYSDQKKNRISIRFFENIIRLILGDSNAGNEVLGTKNNAVLAIKSNGNIEAVDSLKICGDGFTKTKLNILENDFNDIVNEPLILKYYNAHKESVLCEKCNLCNLNKICGGGQLAHRYSSKNGFDNPSVYCSQMIKLLVHIQNKIFDELPIEIIIKSKLERLSINDF